MATDLGDDIATSAQSPKRVRGDEGEVEQQPLSELIEADRYLKSDGAAAAPHRAVHFAKLVASGSQ